MAGPSVRAPFPGYENFSDELRTLVSMQPPSFIYVQDTEALPTTLSVIDALLRDLSFDPPSYCHTKVCYASIDSISCFTAKLLYESIINTLVGWEPKWDDGCENWMPENGLRWNDNMDTFLHGLRAAHAHLCRKNVASVKGKGKAKKTVYDDVRLVIVVERVERLKENLPDLLVPLTRLAELARLDLTVIFVSQVGWEDVRPPYGASPDPYYIDIQAPSREDIVQSLVANFSALSSVGTSSLNPYHPSLTSLYAHFAKMLCDVCFPYTHNPQELHYLAAARWPGFCKPLIDEHKQTLQGQGEEDDDDVEMGEHTFLPPTEDFRLRLIKLFTPSITTAMETLLPRLTNASDWALANEPPENALSVPGYKHSAFEITKGETGVKSLPRMSKFILLASFVASTNPPKSDIRMFGRGADDKKRKRRARKAPAGKARGGGPSKVAQRLLGPTPFTLDRMIAILGALLEENDAESRISSRLRIPGEHTDMEIGRVGVFSSVMELTSMRLLHRTTAVDRLDGPPQFKCAISYDVAMVLAKQLHVALNDLLWDPV
ncbi:hypothetical protein CPC08DRAFT_674975 [Agrocybe pediades]|nr:hypothetical protein CPC08DRAFT_674975 [Agrocybe pediades]